jgi:hypothetical protein
MNTPSKQKRGLSFVGCQMPPSTHPRRAGAEAWGKKRHFYKPLPKQFRRDGFNYRQIVRDEDGAVYEQIWNACQNPDVTYEVIRIRRREGFEIHHRFVEPAEIYPNSESWGTDGFTFTDKDAAFERLREVCR